MNRALVEMDCTTYTYLITLVPYISQKLYIMHVILTILLKLYFRSCDPFICQYLIGWYPMYVIGRATSTTIVSDRILIRLPPLQQFLTESCLLLLISATAQSRIQHMRGRNIT